MILFQSLFYWKLLWKEKVKPYYVTADNGFNPYSIGSYSGRNIIASLLKSFVWFQSLFYWKLLWKLIRCIFLVVKLEMFQSLFDWKLLWKRFHFVLFIWRQLSFNPYSIGSYSGRLFARGTGKTHGGFNPYSIGSYSGSPNGNNN